MTTLVCDHLYMDLMLHKQPLQSPASHSIRVYDLLPRKRHGRRMWPESVVHFFYHNVAVAFIRPERVTDINIAVTGTCADVGIQGILRSFQSSHSGTALVKVTCQSCIMINKQRSTASCPDSVHRQAGSPK